MTSTPAQASFASEITHELVFENRSSGHPQKPAHSSQTLIARLDLPGLRLECTNFPADVSVVIVEVRVDVCEDGRDDWPDEDCFVEDCFVEGDRQLQTTHTNTHPPGRLRVTLCRNAFHQRLAAQMPSVSLPLTDRSTIADPSLLHLIQLLKAEIFAPQMMNQVFVWSIVTILALHLYTQCDRQSCRVGIAHSNFSHLPTIHK